MDVDKGRHRVKVGRFRCWLLFRLLFCVVLYFSVVSLVRLSVRCQNIISIDTAFFSCSPVCVQVE